jgi:beta-lactamase superfamily II metal-dependent hydrolase
MSPKKKSPSKKTAAKKIVANRRGAKATSKRPAPAKARAAAGGGVVVGAQADAMPLAPGHVRIRMYNVGFGDAFLIIIPGADGERPRKILIDCGVHASGTNRKLKLEDLVKHIIEDVSEQDGKPRIDVVVATHRHRDHVHGFREADWQKVEVGEVWMPWTEHPTDPRAREIREIQGKIAQQLNRALEKKMREPGKFGLTGRKLKEVKDLKEFVSNSLTLPNEEAMLTLHDGFAVFGGRKKVERRFLPPEDRKEHSFECDLLPGVVVHVLGPSRDPSVIRDMNPPKGMSYLRMVESLPTDGEEKLLPFREQWVIADADNYNRHHALSDAKGPGSGDRPLLTDKEMEKIRNAGEGTEFGVAVKLEDAVNGTSLMLMFEIGKSFLLFPGDAQWGTWEAAKNDAEWYRLLQKTNFYKVSHHGSHNATPVEFVEKILKKDFWGMVSLRPIEKYKEIPRKPLLDALRNKPGKIVRMDVREPNDPPDFRRVGDQKTGDVYVEVDIPI